MFIVLHVADFPLQAALRAVAPVSDRREELPQPSQRTTFSTVASPLPTALIQAGHRPALLSATLAPSSAYLTHPAALFSGTTKKSVALSANARARAAGVELGMSAPQAIARCADLLIRTSNDTAEADARAVLLAGAFTISPHVEATAPGLVTLDAHGLAPTARAPACHAAIARLASLDLFATAGIARTPLLALYAARQVAPVSNRRMALTPLPRSTPNSVAAQPLPAGHRPALPHASALDVSPSAETAFLAPLPLATAEPTAELVGVLHAWGLRTLGDLTRLSRDDVGRRLGAAGTALWDRARGGEPRPLHLVAPPQELAAAMEFEDALETLEPLLFILRRFLDRLTLELEAAHRVAAELDLTLTLADDNAHARSFRLPEPTRDLEILFRTLHTHLESVRTDSPIVAARLRVTPTRPLVRQHGLFETGLRDPHGFAETLARVVAIVGSDRVGTPQFEDTHRPDAVKLVPPPAVIPAPAPPPVQPALGRPLRRFRPPLPARFEMSDGQPTFLWTERVQGVVAAQRGPWHSSGEWWQADRAWGRAEWDIALADGGIYRLFRTAEGWFLEGEYD
ncbi:MAG: DNA polymerase Y family protein [Opitutae bacterium]|nr:DNA polymerase Y family protein [Opitutae bacterium]